MTSHRIETLAEGVRLYPGDCLDVLKTLESNSIDACVTDPPYHLVSIKHPTVKPVDLIQYLVRLVTPPKGLCLDPFAGTGTLGEACIRESMRSILIEREAEYCDDVRRRMKLAMAGLGEREWESVKAKTKGKPVDHGPLFGVVSA